MNLAMKFPQISLLFRLFLAFIGNVNILGAFAEDPACYLISYDVVNLTRTAYWELDWNGKNGCLENVESCKFFFSICKPLIPVITGEGPRCPNSAVCLEVPPADPKNKTLNGTFYGIGNHKSNPFQGEATTQFWARYPEGQPYKKPDNTTCKTSTILHFICDKTKPWIPNPDPSKSSKVPMVRQVTYIPQTCSHVISMPYAGACPREAQPIPSGGLSGGSVLLIMFICAMSVYLVGGVTYNHCQGAQGKEMVPHADFWEDLPKNIKAGFTLTQQVLTCQEIPTQSPTYEQL